MAASYTLFEEDDYHGQRVKDTQPYCIYRSLGALPIQQQRNRRTADFKHNIRPFTPILSLPYAWKSLSCIEVYNKWKSLKITVKPNPITLVRNIHHFQRSFFHERQLEILCDLIITPNHNRRCPLPLRSLSPVSLCAVNQRCVQKHTRSALVFQRWSLCTPALSIHYA